MSVAELCRRLGSAPATTDSVSSSGAPVLVGDLLRREGRPPVPAAQVAPRPAPEPDEDQPVVPTPRSRGDACRTALGAGGLVVAGSVLGAALLAAAGVGGPLPFGQGGDDPSGQFQGEGTLVKPGTAYGSVRGRDVVARSGLLRAIAYYTPFGSSTGAADRAGARVAASVPSARAVVPVQTLAPAGAGVPAGPVAGVVTPVVGGVTQTTGHVLGEVTGAAGPVLGGVMGAAEPAATVIAPLASDVATAVTPVTDLAGTVIAPVLEPMTPVMEAAAPLVNAAAPVVAGTEAVIQPVVAVAGPAVAPALNAVGPVLAFADPLLPSLPEELTDPLVDPTGGVADDLPAVPGSFAQAATGNAVSAVRDVAAGTTSAVQAATDTAPQVLPIDPAGTAGRVVARTETPPVDPPTQPIPIVVPQATNSPAPAVVDAAGVLTTIVPVQATGSPAPATDAALPTKVLSSQDVAGPDKTEARTKAEAEPPTEPLRIVAPRDDPEPSTAPLRIIAPEKSDDARTDSKPDSAGTPAPERISAAQALTDKAGDLLSR